MFGFGNRSISRQPDERVYNMINDHLGKFFGHNATVSHPAGPMFNDIFHLDLFMYPAEKNRDYLQFVTCGMSALPMPVPPRSGAPQFIELVVKISAKEWDFTRGPKYDEYPGWMIMALHDIARFPFRNNTFFADGHSVDEYYIRMASGGKFWGYILVDPSQVGENLPPCRIDSQKEVHFLQLIPITLKEMESYLKDGPEKSMKKGFLKNKKEVVSFK
jgi:hypothetical protein